MRLYSFVNYYLSSLQQGLQTAHVVAELSSLNHQWYNDWAAKHKTIIILNGGNNAELIDLRGFLSGFSSYPSASFYEDGPSLGGVMTAHGIILPSTVCEAIDRYRADRGLSESDWPALTQNDFAIIERVATYGLAR